jgi:hypothetical protein
VLNSFGRIYTDANGPIRYNEYGPTHNYLKKFMDDRLKFTGSMRYDKAQNFDGNYSPRVSLVCLGESRNIILEVHSKQVLETQLHKINISDST